MTPIPLSLMQAGREITEPRMSNDRRIGFVQRWRGSTSINCMGLDDGVERMLTFGPEPVPGRGFGGGCFSWVGRRDGPAAVVYCGDDGELWCQDGIRLERITSHGRTVRAPSATGVGGEAAPHRVVYAVDEAEIWMTEVETGASRRLDDGRHAFCFDPVVAPDERSVAWQGWSPPDMPWDGAERVDLDLVTGAIGTWAPDDGAVQQPRFTPAGEQAHVHDGSGWLNVYISDRAVAAEEIEQAGPTWGMGNRTYAIDATGRRIAFTRNEGGFGSLCIADVSSGEVEQLGRGVHGHLSWVGDHVVALRSGARTAPQIVAYTVASSAPTSNRSTIAVSQPDAWPTSELPAPATIRATSSVDGLDLYARRYAAGNGRMLVQVHGGPTDQWQVDWRPRIVYWWSRGWDVLVVDPRGTTGHGRRYQQALHGTWGRGDVDDTADLIAWAHAEGWATPASTALLGGSSGGLTVLGVLADRSDLVAAGVASYPVSDLDALTKSTHRFEAHYTDTLVAPDDGSNESQRRFRELSPLHRAGSITAPLLLFHGSDDPVVPVDQSTALASTIRDAGGDVDFVVYEGEGHGFRQPDHVADEYERTERFLDRLLPRRAWHRTTDV